ncbi:MAG: hypothetical protein KC613_15040 [Myxococcales bacterium]|nr:hypothetical protein [Myxococcales bacterium]MCB9523092.1 hypothetical protein [Myxococcales bacterium]
MNRRLAVLLALLAAAVVALMWPRPSDGVLIHGEWKALARGAVCPLAGSAWTLAVTGDDPRGSAAQAFAAAAPGGTGPGAVAVSLVLRFEAEAGWFSGLSEVHADVHTRHVVAGCAAEQRWRLVLTVDEGVRGSAATARAHAGRTVAAHLAQALRVGRRP